MMKPKTAKLIVIITSFSFFLILFANYFGSVNVRYIFFSSLFLAMGVILLVPFPPTIHKGVMTANVVLSGLTLIGTTFLGMSSVLSGNGFLLLLPLLIAIQLVCGLVYLINSKQESRPYGQNQNNDSYTGSTEDELVTKLKTLKRLYDDGYITKDEYEQKRKDILDL